MAKRGRKSKYETHIEPNIKKIPHWRKDGLTEEQVAMKCGVAYSTFRTYIKKFPALQAAIKKGKEDLIIEIENSLYKRAMGYEYEETEIIAKKEGKSSKPIKVTKKKKQVAPDTTAIIFALKNLRPEKWKDRQEIDMTANNTIHDMRDMTKEEREKRKQELRKKFGDI